SRKAARQADFQPDVNTSIPHTRNLQPDAVDAGAGSDVERSGVFVAPGYVGYTLRHFDGSEVFPIRGNDPDAARARAVQVSFFIYPDAVGSANGFGIGCLVGKGVEKERSFGD